MGGVTVLFLAGIVPALSLTNIKALWKSTTFSLSSVTAGAHVELTAPSEFVCAAQALLQYKSSLYCFGGDHCVVSFESGKQATGGFQPGPWTCKCVVPTCPDGFEAVGCVGCFYFSKTEKLIADAKMACRVMGSSLASLSVLSEFDAVVHYVVRKKTVEVAFLVDLLRINGTEFVWGDGTILFSAPMWMRPWCYYYGHSDSHTRGCAVMHGDFAFYLYNIPCWSRPFICRV